MNADNVRGKTAFMVYLFFSSAKVEGTLGDASHRLGKKV
jgi:hypothetical protein